MVNLNAAIEETHAHGQHPSDDFLAKVEVEPVREDPLSRLALRNVTDSTSLPLFGFGFEFGGTAVRVFSERTDSAPSFASLSDLSPALLFEVLTAFSVFSRLGSTSTISERAACHSFRVVSRDAITSCCFSSFLGSGPVGLALLYFQYSGGLENSRA